MGISRILYSEYLDFKSKILTEDLDLLELGDQDVCFHGLDKAKFRENESNSFRKWVSLDLHNRPGVNVKDLSVIDKDFETFDIVTNFGTSEHVEPEIGHYNCWLNMHNWTKKNGYSIHEVPEIGGWKNHCRFYYTMDFFMAFKNIGYHIECLKANFYEDQGNLIFCILKKDTDLEFMSFDDFNKLIKIERTSSDLIAINNTQHIASNGKNEETFIYMYK
jgi:hypothetical protein